MSHKIALLRSERRNEYPNKNYYGVHLPLCEGKKKNKNQKKPNFCYIEESTPYLLLPLCLETHSGWETPLENLDTT